MADAPLSDTFRVTGASLGAASFYDVIGGSIGQTIGLVESFPAARLSPATCVDTFRQRAAVRFQKRQVPIAPGTGPSTLTFNVLEIGGTPGTIASATMVAGEYHWNGNVKPHEHEQHFFFDAGNSENVSPISIT